MTQLAEPVSPRPGVPTSGGTGQRVRQRAPGRDRDHQRPARPRQVKLRVSQDEYATIAGAARDAGLTPSGYAAETALAAAAGADPPSAVPWRTALAELIEARTQVRRIGTNINQAARAINADGEPPTWLEHALTITERAIQSLDVSAAALQRLASTHPAAHR
jgi:hypothetical protein